MCRAKSGAPGPDSGSDIRRHMGLGHMQTKRACVWYVRKKK